MDSTFSFVMLMRLVRRVISLSHCLLLTDNGSGEGDSWVGRGDGGGDVSITYLKPKPVLGRDQATAGSGDKPLGFGMTRNGLVTRAASFQPI